MTLEELRDAYLAAQLAGDRRGALALIVDEGVKKKIPVPSLARDVIQAAQREIGRMWEENRISVAEEHMATAISQVALAHLYQHAAPERPKNKKIVVACVEGELHDFPARLVADALDLEGYGVRFLGANVPIEGLLAILAKDTPQLLALSVTMSFNVGALRIAVQRVREKFPGLPVAIGGHATLWSANIGRELAPDAIGGDAASMVEAANRLLDGKTT